MKYCIKICLFKKPLTCLYLSCIFLRGFHAHFLENTAINNLSLLKKFDTSIDEKISQTAAAALKRHLRY